MRHNTWVSIADVADVATIADVADENGWKIRARGHRTFHDIFEKIYAFPLPNISVGADKVLWRRDETNYQDRFHSASTLNYQRSKKNRVPWRKLVWFSQAVPRHSFMVWLALRNQLSTGDRMWFWVVMQGCPLCGEVNETRDHLFFCLSLLFHGLDQHSREDVGCDDHAWLGGYDRLSPSACAESSGLCLKENGVSDSFICYLARKELASPWQIVEHSRDAYKIYW